MQTAGAVVDGAPIVTRSQGVAESLCSRARKEAPQRWWIPPAVFSAFPLLSPVRDRV